LKSTTEDVWLRRNEIRKQIKIVAIRLKAKAFENAKIAVDLLEEN
jgi:hypothetical protein